jgi:hypothetical protein
MLVRVDDVLRRILSDSNIELESTPQLTTFIYAFFVVTMNAFILSNHLLQKLTPTCHLSLMAMI